MSKQPKKIGKYDVIGTAGKGAMGIVYIGHDPFVDRRVAIKVQRYEETEDLENTAGKKQAKRLFFNEAQSAGALDHPNILRVYDAGEADGQPYIAMEYIEHVDTLRSFCVPDRLLPIATVLGHMIACAKALDYAHRQGVTHRDIKPANIMVTKEGQVKIGDFGIAQRTHTERTQVIGWFGSPMYMSPEQARNEPLTYQTDLFSLGVVMYELLSGVQAFKATAIHAVISNILNKEPKPLPELRPEIPEKLAAIVRRALAKELTRRYQSGAEMAADLAAVLEALDEPFANMSQEEKFRAVRGLDFFRGFSDSEVSEVIRASDWETHPFGVEVVKQGDGAGAFYIAVSGHAWVRKDGKEIAMLSEGEVFGEMGYLARNKRSATVVAASKLSLMKIARPYNEWASLPCQLRLNKAFQRILIERLERASSQLARTLE